MSKEIIYVILSWIIVALIAVAIFSMVFALVSGIYHYVMPSEKFYEVTYTGRSGEVVTIITGKDKRTDIHTGVYHNYWDYDTYKEIKKGKQNER